MKVYKITITSHSGKNYEQYLKSSELHLLSTILDENESVLISKHTVTKQFIKNNL